MAKKKYEKSFFIDMNMQNPPRPGSRMWYIRKADSKSNPKHTVLGYEYTLDRREDSFGEAEGSSPELNFRMAFLPEEDHYWVSRDFAGQELRIMANLSGEEAWVNAFLTGGDPHKATAVLIWGEENYNSDYRKKAKAINFGMIYGMGAPSLAEDLKVSQEEAQSYIDLFFEKLPSVARFLNRSAMIALEEKEITNLYGRKRRVHNYITPYGNLSGFGKRISYNTPVQSVGAEITKLALIKIYNGILNNPEFKDNVFFMNTIHDEINLSVTKEPEMLKKVVKRMGDLMLHKMPNGPVPIISELDIGNCMGLVWPFEQDEETLELKPVYYPIKEDSK